jgi:hypothetical protein
MRADFVGECAKVPGLAEVINRTLCLVPRMTRDQLRSAIEGPVSLTGGRVEPTLVQRLLNE